MTGGFLPIGGIIIGDRCNIKAACTIGNARRYLESQVSERYQCFVTGDGWEIGVAGIA
jgi:hypothetical protein